MEISRSVSRDAGKHLKVERRLMPAGARRHKRPEVGIAAASSNFCSELAAVFPHSNSPFVNCQFALGLTLGTVALILSATVTRGADYPYAQEDHNHKFWWRSSWAVD